jgi:hypothetical protein
VVLGVLGDVLIPATLAVTGFIEGLFGLPGVMGILTSMAP